VDGQNELHELHRYKGTNSKRNSKFPPASDFGAASEANSKIQIPMTGMRPQSGNASCLEKAGEMRKALTTLAFTLFGASIGTGLGVLATYGLVKLCVALSPNDPTAASAGDACLLLVPGGLIWGALVGAGRAKDRMS
jgi:hypothetical protein